MFINSINIAIDNSLVFINIFMLKGVSYLHIHAGKKDYW